jgi:hypothetical protein
MTYRSYPYAWISYCICQYFINIFFNQKLKIPSKFDSILGFSDFDKIFCYEFKTWKVIYGFFQRFLYYLFIEVIFEGSCFELKKVNF